MPTTGAISPNTPIFWLTIGLTLFFIAILTYVYSGKNLRLTLTFTFWSIVVVACLAGFDSWSQYLTGHLIARIEATGEYYRASRSGWFILLDAWPLWLAPALLLALFAGGAVAVIQNLLASKQPKQADSNQQQRRGLSSEMVASQLELDTIKRALINANTKLTQIDSEKKLEETKLKELKVKLKKFELEEYQSQSTTNDELKALQVEVSAKNKQIAQLTQQLLQQDGELTRLQVLIDGLLYKL